MEEIDSIDALNRRRTQQRQQCRRDIARPRQPAAAFTGAKAWSFYDQRNPQRRLVDEEAVRLLAVLAQSFPVIAHHHSDPAPRPVRLDAL